MNPGILLAIAFGGALITYLSGKISEKVRDILAVLVSLTLVGIVVSLYNVSSRETLYIGFLNLPLILRVNTFSWFFAITIAAAGSLSIIFSLSYIRKKGIRIFTTR